MKSLPLQSLVDYSRAGVCLIVIVLTGCVFASNASADVYKCRTSAGKLEISNKPCPSGSKTEATKADEVVSVEQRKEAEADLQRAKEYIAGREAAQAEERARQAAIPPQPPPPLAPAPATQGAAPPVPGGGTTIVVIDPVSRCIANAELARVLPQRREGMIAACRNQLAPPPAVAANSPVVQPAVGGKKVDLYLVPNPAKCRGDRCPR